MPTYDYECDACGHTFELFQSDLGTGEEEVPGMRQTKTPPPICTGAAIVFKGSGFYQTDYRSDSYKKGAEKE